MMVIAVPNPYNRRRCEAASEILSHILHDGPLPASQVRAVADALGQSWRTMQRVSLLLGVQRRKDGMQAGWTWTLPPADESEGANRLGAFGAHGPRPQGEEAPTCLAAYGYEVPDDGLMHGVPQHD